VDLTFWLTWYFGWNETGSLVGNRGEEQHYKKGTVSAYSERAAHPTANDGNLSRIPKKGLRKQDKASSQDTLAQRSPDPSN
jgi:putative IMPACT (imprinted ancient) family translation regulator